MCREAILRDIYRPVKETTIEWEATTSTSIAAACGRWRKRKKRATRPLPRPVSSLWIVAAGSSGGSGTSSATRGRPSRADSAPRHYSAQDHIRYNEVDADSDDDDED